MARWVWTGLDVACWRRLADAADVVTLQATTRRGVSKGGLRQLGRAAYAAQRAVIPTHDLTVIGHYRAFVQIAMATALADAPDVPALTLSAARVRTALDILYRSARKPERAQMRLPYADN